MKARAGSHERRHAVRPNLQQVRRAATDERARQSLSQVSAALGAEEPGSAEASEKTRKLPESDFVVERTPRLDELEKRLEDLEFGEPDSRRGDEL